MVCASEAVDGSLLYRLAADISWHILTHLEDWLASLVGEEIDTLQKIGHLVIHAWVHLLESNLLFVFEIRQHDDHSVEWDRHGSHLSIFVGT